MIWSDHFQIISLLENFGNFGKCIAVPSILMYLLAHKNWDNIWEVSGDPERQRASFIKGEHKNFFKKYVNLLLTQ